jgi:RNA-directed DNA polymerase
MLRGWAQYHSPVVAKEAFSKMEPSFPGAALVDKTATQRKNAEWVRKKYFASFGDRNWVFGTEFVEDDGNGAGRSCIRLLARPSDGTRRFGDFNPFDPAQEMYGENLRRDRMLESMSHRKQWIRLYVDQRGLCAVCQCKITKETGWHDHHIVYRTHGGSDALEIAYCCIPTATSSTPSWSNRCETGAGDVQHFVRA